MMNFLIKHQYLMEFDQLWHLSNPKTSGVSFGLFVCRSLANC